MVLTGKHKIYPILAAVILKNMMNILRFGHFYIKIFVIKNNENGLKVLP